MGRKTTTTIRTVPAQRIPGIDIRPTDKPGEAVARSLRAPGRGGGNGGVAPSRTPAPRPIIKKAPPVVKPAAVKITPGLKQAILRARISTKKLTTVDRFNLGKAAALSGFITRFGKADVKSFIEKIRRTKPQRISMEIARSISERTIKQKRQELGQRKTNLISQALNFIKLDRSLTPQKRLSLIRMIKPVIDSAVSEKIKKVGFEDADLERIFGSLEVGRLLKQEKIFKTLKEVSPKAALGVEALTLVEKKVITPLRVGIVKDIRDRPTDAAISFALGGAFPPATKAIGGLKITRGIAPFIPLSIKKNLPKVLFSTYLASSGLDVARAKKGKRVEVVGEKIMEIVPFIVGSNLGVRGLLRGELKSEISKTISKLPSRKRKAFNELIRKSDILGKTKTTVRDLDIARLKRIPNKAKPSILRFLKKEDVIVGGSVGQQAQVKVKRSLAESDLDLYLDKGSSENLARKLVNTLKKEGVKRVSRVKGTVTIAGKKVAEFHDISRLHANIESVIPIWKSPESFIIRNKQGIRVPKITVQLKRKLVGGFTDPIRGKDLKDAKDILNQLFRRAERQARGKFFFKEKNIRALEKEFGVKISRKPVKIKGKKIVQITSKIKPIKLKPIKPKPVLIPKRKPVFKPKPKPKKRPSQPTVKKRPSQPTVKGRPSQPPVKGRPSQPPVSVRERPGPGLPPRKPGPSPRPRPRPRPSQLPVEEKSRPGPPPRPRPRPRPKPKKRRPKKPGILIGIKRKPKKIKRKEKLGFDILAKSRGRFVKLNKIPLSRSDALSRGAYAIDHSTARTTKILPGKRVKRLGTVKLKEKGYFTKNRVKLRSHRIVKGKKKPLRNAYIERRKHGIDTRGEKKGLSLAKLIKREGYLKPKTKTKKRKIKSQRKTINKKRKSRGGSGILDIF